MERRPINRVVQPMEEGLPEVSPTEVVVEKHQNPQPQDPTPTTMSDDDWAKEIEKEKAEQEAVLKKLEAEEKATEQKVVEVQQHDASTDQKIAELEKQLAALKAQQAKPIVQEQPKPQPTPVAEPPKQESSQETTASSDPENPFDKLQKDELGGSIPQTSQEIELPKEESVDPIQKKHEETAKKNNCSNRVFTDNGTEEDLDNAIVTYDREDQRDDDAKEESPSPGIIAMSLCAQAGQKTKQARMMNRFINEPCRRVSFGSPRSHHVFPKTTKPLRSIYLEMLRRSPFYLVHRVCIGSCSTTADSGSRFVQSLYRMHLRSFMRLTMISKNSAGSWEDSSTWYWVLI